MRRLLALTLCLLVLPLFACAGQTEPTPTPTPEPTAPAPADYRALDALLLQVPAELSSYTKASAEALSEALARIDRTLTQDEQDAVDATVAEIKAALAGLKTRLTFGSLQEIIDYVDGLGLDFSDLAAFSMEGLFEEAVLAQTPHAGEEYLNETFYIGDSITLYMHRYSSLSSQNIYGVGSINPQHAALDDIVTLRDGTPATFAEALAEDQPRRVVITIGTNSMLMASIDYLTYFEILIDDIRAACPNTDIILQSTSPLTATYEAGMRSLTNRSINRANLLLAGLAVHKGIYFLNSAEALKDANGQLDTRFDLGEGYGHINEAAYRVWEEYLCTHAIPD